MPAHFATAAALALGAALSLGLARFSYALLLPAMRSELGWSYVTAGAMNTVNAAGYLLGALAMPWLLRRWPARRLFIAGGLGAALLLALHGIRLGEPWLYACRLLLGAGSALTFVAGGLLAARLGSRPGARATLVLGLYYGGTGLGIVAASLLLPPLLLQPARWPQAWWLLAVLAAAACALMAAGSRSLDEGAVTAQPARSGGWRWRDFGFGLTGYLCFGLGYIGYMTFIVAMLREQGVGPLQVAVFYTLLGMATVASSWLWAPLLARYRDGRPMALLNALLALATLLPVLSRQPALLLASGLLFGAVFLAVVASTTALVRHNLDASAWPAGITAFTVVFAAGQIAGPTLVGWVADGAGGLQPGLAVSAGVLLLGSLIALAQRHLRP